MGVARRVLAGGAVGAVAYAAWNWWRRRVPDDEARPTWGPAPFPFPPAPRSADGATSHADTASTTADDGAPWQPPRPDGSCPDGYPVKAKSSSGIFHVPGGASYERTRPDRCYRDPAAAERDGLRAARA